jgi:hypothetical protein
MRNTAFFFFFCMLLCLLACNVGCGGISGESPIVALPFEGVGVEQWSPLVTEPAGAGEKENPFSDLTVAELESWNLAARALVSRKIIDACTASRLYAALSIGMHDGALLSLKTGGSSTNGAAEAARLIMRELIPSEAAFWDDLAKSQRKTHLAGTLAGRQAANSVIYRLSTDLSEIADEASIEVGPGFWTPEGSERAVLPGWGRVTKWASGLPPDVAAPAIGSDEERLAASEVANATKEASIDQIALARKYALGKGTPTPPGLWNEFVFQTARRCQVDQTTGIRVSRVLALMNAAMMDAGVDCWNVKYQAMRRRPTQIDSQVRLHIALPSHPSFPSGHSSFSGAATTILSTAWPGLQNDWTKELRNASISRFYGGVHFLHDLEAGEKIGRSAGERVLLWQASLETR